MKVILTSVVAFIATLVILVKVSEACIVVQCPTAANCTSPCFQCGNCRQFCCTFIGRSDDPEERLFTRFCAPGEGREESYETSEEIDYNLDPGKKKLT